MGFGLIKVKWGRGWVVKEKVKSPVSKFHLSFKCKPTDCDDNENKYIMA